eukprot:13748-Heterococcus_DN1.PRE.2
MHCHSKLENHSTVSCLHPRGISAVIGITVAAAVVAVAAATVAAAATAAATAVGAAVVAGAACVITHATCHSAVQLYTLQYVHPTSVSACLVF